MARIPRAPTPGTKEVRGQGVYSTEEKPQGQRAGTQSRWQRDEDIASGGNGKEVALTGFNAYRGTESPRCVCMLHSSTLTT